MTDKSPDAYRTISEAGEEAGLPAHVLRFWEGKFPQLKPVKRAGGRRLYRPGDISLLKGLRRLLYEEGYTIKGAQKYLRDHGVAHVCKLGESEGALEVAAIAAERPVTEAPENQTTGTRAPEGGDHAVQPRESGADADVRAAARRAMARVEQARRRLGAALGRTP